MSLPSKIRSFNYNTISDVILQMSYTAQEGDREAGEESVLNALEAYASSNGLQKVISFKYEYSNEFHKLLNSAEQTIEFDLTMDYFPYFLINKDISLEKVTVYLKPKKG